MGVALHNIAMCLVSVNDFHGALAAYKATHTFAYNHGLQVLARQADYNIAELHHLRGEYTRAIRMLLTTRDACCATGDQYHVALCNLDLSEIYLQLNLHGPAEENAHEASLGFQALGMGYEAGKSMVNLALATAGQKRYTLALEMLVDARRQFVAEENLPWRFQIDLYRAAILMQQGSLHEVQRLCSGALRFFRAAHIPSKTIESQLFFARSHMLAGNLPRAMRSCSAALTLLSRRELPVLACQAQQLMGRIYFAAGKTRKAYRRYHAARELLEGMRSGLRAEEMKISFMEDKLEIYEGLVQLLINSSSKSNKLEEAFQCIEQMKSRSLQEIISSSQPDESGPNHNEMEQRAKDLRAELNWYCNRFAQEQLRGSQRSPKGLDELQAAIHKRERELLRLAREMPGAEAESAGLVPSRPMTLAEICTSLPAGCTLLEYFQIRDRLMAVVLTRTNLKILPVTTLAQIAIPLERLEFQIAKFRLGADYLKTFGDSLLQTMRQHLRKLYEQLLEPVEKQLEGQQLLIVPHGRLHKLPFQALFDGNQYLIDRFQIAYAPSATIYAICHGRPTNANSASLVMGVSDAIAPLILSEVKAVAEIIPGAELFVGEQATADVLRQKGSQCRWIHIATHGHFRQDSPMFSGIQLGDSMLSLYDLYRIKLPVELITLSGCTTGASMVAGGDELLGLVRGLIYAGAKGALLTLWEVQDSSTLEFMVDF